MKLVNICGEKHLQMAALFAMLAQAASSATGDTFWGAAAASLMDLGYE